MRQSDWESVMRAATDPAALYFASLPDRSVYRPTDAETIRAIDALLRCAG